MSLKLTPFTDTPDKYVRYFLGKHQPVQLGRGKRRRVKLVTLREAPVRVMAVTESEAALQRANKQAEYAREKFQNQPRTGIISKPLTKEEAMATTHVQKRHLPPAVGTSRPVKKSRKKAVSVSKKNVLRVYAPRISKRASVV